MFEERGKLELSKGSERGTQRGLGAWRPGCQQRNRFWSDVKTRPLQFFPAASFGSHFLLSHSCFGPDNPNSFNITHTFWLWASSSLDSLLWTGCLWQPSSQNWVFLAGEGWSKSTSLVLSPVLSLIQPKMTRFPLAASRHWVSVKQIQRADRNLSDNTSAPLVRHGKMRGGRRPVVCQRS